MGVKTEIINALLQVVKDLGIFKTVKRFIPSVENVSLANLPAFYLNSTRVKADLVNFNERRVLIDFEFLIIDKSDKYENIDFYEEKLLELLCSEIHPKVIGIQDIEINEKINDGQLNVMVLYGNFTVISRF